MKNGVLCLFVCFFFSACKKTVEKKAEDVIVQAMVSGQWMVTKFVKGSDTLTANFSPYKFQFKENNIVDAIKNGSVETSGSWQGNAETRSIASQFASASAPINLLNGTWVVTKNSWTYVEAIQTVNGEALALRLDKQ